MPSPFSITAPTNTILLDANLRGQAVFTVSNVSGQPIRGRALLAPDSSPGVRWLSIAGTTERDWPIGGTERYEVRITAPQDAAIGHYVFRLDMVGVENPTELYSEGPSATFQVPPHPLPKRFPWWIAAAAGAVVLAVVLAIVFWPRQTVVPPLQGLTFAEALTRIADAHLRFADMNEVTDETVPKGRVVRSDPREGSSVRRGSPLTLFVSTGSTPPVAFSLVDHAPLATWTTNDPRESSISWPWPAKRGRLALGACQGDALQGGSICAKGLYTRPPSNPSPDGFVQGEFTVPRLGKGQHFRAKLGFKKNAACIGSRYAVDVLVQWNTAVPFHKTIVRSGNLTAIDLDLSDFEGHSGRLVIKVGAKNDVVCDQLYWIDPKIEEP